MTSNQLQYDANKISSRNADSNAMNAATNAKQLNLSERQFAWNKRKDINDMARNWLHFWV